MNKKVVDRYINDLVEMDNDDLLFEYRFCSLSIEKLQCRYKNSVYDSIQLDCEKIRLKMCENEILKRMGGNNYEKNWLWKYD